MRPEGDVYSYVQDLEKHLQMTSFGGMADPEAQPQPSLDAVGDRLGVGRHRRPGVADHGRGPGGQLLAGQRELRGFGQIVLRADAARRWLGADHREPRPVLHGAPFDVRLPLPDQPVSALAGR